ncbi:MAG: hypothetical protein ACRCVW_07185 [Brevinema sp.]
MFRIFFIITLFLITSCSLDSQGTSSSETNLPFIDDPSTHTFNQNMPAEWIPSGRVLVYPINLTNTCSYPINFLSIKPQNKDIFQFRIACIATGKGSQVYGTFIFKTPISGTFDGVAQSLYSAAITSPSDIEATISMDNEFLYFKDNYGNDVRIASRGREQSLPLPTNFNNAFLNEIWRLTYSGQTFKINLEDPSAKNYSMPRNITDIERKKLDNGQIELQLKNFSGSFNTHYKIIYTITPISPSKGAYTITNTMNGEAGKGTIEFTDTAIKLVEQNIELIYRGKKII